MTSRVKALLSLISLLALLGLGILARTRVVTRHDLHVDRTVAGFRFPVGTDIALALTAGAGEVVGVVLLLVGLVVLVVRRRRWDAALLAAAVGGGWALGLVMKSLIDRGRPPAALWLLAPDSAPSFPSGHDTTACAMIVVAFLVLRGTGRVRVAAVLAATVFALAVGASRVYLGDHYPTDVLGSWLTVATSALVVWTLTDLGVVQRLSAAVLRDPLLPEPA
ncbi:MAG: phosphatase PAP2 family protein [Acidobacteria bacterium]|nr:phosphatase PAP2 family protein [Acidobacteriota bacterium]